MRPRCVRSRSGRAWLRLGARRCREDEFQGGLDRRSPLGIRSRAQLCLVRPGGRGDRRGLPLRRVEGSAVASRARLESASPRVLDEACALGASRLDERLRGGARCAVRLELALQPVHRRERAATTVPGVVSAPFTGRPSLRLLGGEPQPVRVSTAPDPRVRAPRAPSRWRRSHARGVARRRDRGRSPGASCG